jgi:predicted Zn-dependent protease
MLGERRCRELVERLLAASPADQTEISIFGNDAALTRFANSTVHQNVSETDAEVRLRVVVGRRVGLASTNDLSAESLAKVASRAMTVAQHQREDPEFPGLAPPAPIPEVPSFDPPTAEYTPEARARGVKTICDLVVERGLVASGAFETEAGELAVANSLGLWAYSRSTRAHLKTVVMGDGEAAGYAERTSRRVSDIDFESAGREAVERAERGRDPNPVEPGEYQVVLHEYAVGELLHYMSYMGFGALALQEGHSFLTGRLGERIMSAEVSIWDDGKDPRGLPSGFDFEGVPKQKVPLIDKGVARGVVYDTRTAAREGGESTGHALPAPNTYGPLAWNLFMAPGQSTTEQMVQQVDRGIWVTRFHYVNVLHPRQAVLTGMTRDGTFLIERGELGKPVRNLRFTESMLRALSGVRAIGNRLAPVKGFGVTLAPALLLESFNFTGVTAAA